MGMKLTKEAVLYEVYTALARALGKRIEPVTCRDNEYALIIDRRWRLHLDREQLDYLHDNISNDGGAIREAFDDLKNECMEFMSFQKASR